jgi:hypothetical protein
MGTEMIRHSTRASSLFSYPQCLSASFHMPRSCARGTRRSHDGAPTDAIAGAWWGRPHPPSESPIQPARAPLRRGRCDVSREMALLRRQVRAATPSEVMGQSVLFGVACDRTCDLQRFYSLLRWAHCSNSGRPAHCKSYP